MASLFVIREKNTGTFCTSSKNNTFATELNAAAMFSSHQAAEKAAKKMFEVLTTAERQQYNEWYIDGVKYHPDLTLYIQQYIGWCGLTEADMRANIIEKTCEMEVVEVRLTLV
jgi:hypothetical protein